MNAVQTRNIKRDLALVWLIATLTGFAAGYVTGEKVALAFCRNLIEQHTEAAHADRR
jgi:hypothetical protein